MNIILKVAPSGYLKHLKDGGHQESVCCWCWNDKGIRVHLQFLSYQRCDKRVTVCRQNIQYCII